MNAENRDEIKLAMKQAIKEWLDEKFMQFGKWTAAGIAAALLASLTYMFLLSHGWERVGSR